MNMKLLPPINHRHSKGQVWHIGKFDKRELLGTLPRAGSANYGSACEKLVEEIYFNPNKTVKPKQFVRAWNILLLVGLEEAAKRDTAQTATTIDWIKLGTDGTAENESQTDLLAGTGDYKQYSVDGGRAVAAGTQTAKYSMVFLDTDGYSLPVTLKEGAQFTLNGGGVTHSRVQFPNFILATGEAILTQINETLVNG